MLTDMDGNRLYDLTGSYGVNLFGVDFYRECVDAGVAAARDFGPVLAVNSERAGARIFRSRRSAVLASDRDAERDRDFALAEAAMSGEPDDETVALAIAADELPGEGSEKSEIEVSGTDAESRLAAQAGAQSDVQPHRIERERDPEY